MIACDRFLVKQMVLLWQSWPVFITIKLNTFKLDLILICFDVSLCSEDESISVDPTWILPEQDDHLPVTSIQMDPEMCVNTSKCIAFNECILDLVKKTVHPFCKKCNQPLNFGETKSGTCLIVVWKCKEIAKKKGGHTYGTWASQPRLHNMYAGNLLVPAATLVSGNNYTKLAMLAKFLNLGFVADSNFYR